MSGVLKLGMNNHICMSLAPVLKSWSIFWPGAAPILKGGATSKLAQEPCLSQLPIVHYRLG